MLKENGNFCLRTIDQHEIASIHQSYFYLKPFKSYPAVMFLLTVHASSLGAEIRTAPYLRLVPYSFSESIISIFICVNFCAIN